MVGGGRVESHASSMKRNGRGLVPGEPTELFNLVLSQSQVEQVQRFVVGFPEEELKRSEVARVAMQLGFDLMQKRAEAGESWSGISNLRAKAG